MSDKVVMPVDTFNKLVDYIQRRPFNEVANIIDEIRNTAAMVESTQVEEEPQPEESVDE